MEGQEEKEEEGWHRKSRRRLEKYINLVAVDKMLILLSIAVVRLHLPCEAGVLSAHRCGVHVSHSLVTQIGKIARNLSKRIHFLLLNWL